MKNTLLLPNKFKKLGWTLLAASIVLWIIILFSKEGGVPWLELNFFTVVNKEPLGPQTFFGFSEVNLGFTLIGGLFISGGLIVAFSREKQEDEFINSLRLSAFQWAVLLNYLILFIAFILIFGTDFFTVLMYNMFTTLAFFILRFHYLLKKTTK